MVDVRKRRIAFGAILGTLLICAFFIAQASMQFVARTVLEKAGESLAIGGDNVRPTGGQRTGSDAKPAPGSEPVDVMAILRRNIFDSASGDLTRPPEPEIDPNAVVEAEIVAPIDPNAPPPPCDGSNRLVGVMANRRNAEWSYAAITNTAGKVLLYREGMSVDGKQVSRILGNAVYMQNGGAPCQLTMFQVVPAPGSIAMGEQPPQPMVASNEPPPDIAPPPAAGGVDTSELDSGIQQSGERNYTIQRSLVDKLLNNQADLMRSARVIPHEENGRVVGVKMYGIRRNSVLGRIGLQNGDMLRTINGFDMTSPAVALEAYTQLKTANHLTVAVVRRGQSMSLDYNIQ